MPPHAQQGGAGSQHLGTDPPRQTQHRPQDGPGKAQERGRPRAKATHQQRQQQRAQRHQVTHQQQARHWPSSVALAASTWAQTHHGRPRAKTTHQQRQQQRAQRHQVTRRQQAHHPHQRGAGSQQGHTWATHPQHQHQQNAQKATGRPRAKATHQERQRHQVMHHQERQQQRATSPPAWRWQPAPGHRPTTADPAQARQGARAQQAQGQDHPPATPAAARPAPPGHTPAADRHRPSRVALPASRASTWDQRDHHPAGHRHSARARQAQGAGTTRNTSSTGGRPTTPPAWRWQPAGPAPGHRPAQHRPDRAQERSKPRAKTTTTRNASSAPRSRHPAPANQVGRLHRTVQPVALPPHGKTPAVGQHTGTPKGWAPGKRLRGAFQHRPA